ncbi:MAG: CPBP family intramembrane metalloprotease [Pyrinomonadaceae bacterium]|nr:CPBP family intramembrane metalloprotease [Sphingobacteriaceae bacterium]
MVHTQSEQRHPFASLLLLLLLALIGAVVFTGLSLLIGYLLYKPASIQNLMDGSVDIAFQKLLLALTSIGMFIVPAFAFAIIENKKGPAYLQLNKPNTLFSIPLAILIMFCAAPLIEWTVLINEKMQLPGFLQEMERWMRQKEDELAELTKSLLVMKNIPALLLNLLVIAVIPALGEELTFRGCVQQTLTRWFKSYHLGIWIAAIAFSAIHIQFYGFIPRMCMGALFGYMLVWSKSIWVPIVAHFYNNASAVIMAYVFQKQGKSLDTLTDPQSFKWQEVILSIIFTSLLLWTLRKLSFNKLIKPTHE